MVKKKAETKNDLTRIEDLSEFTHEESTEINNLFDNFSSDDSPVTESTSAFDSEVTFNTDEDPPSEEPSSEESSEFSFDTSALDENAEASEGLFETSEFQAEEASDEMSSELSFGEENKEEDQEYTQEDEISYADSIIEPEETEEVEAEPYTYSSEKFDDVKTFAQNFSYGKVSTKGGNPPYTIIARHIKYEDDARDILDLLSEFGLVDESNIKETQRSLEFGSMIIPQISEYTAIVLAHKLRRFDLDLEVGLSDEVHPSKSGEGNPKGLLKKDNLKQNRSEHVNLKEINNSIKDIVVTTSASVPGYIVEEYIGVQTTFSIVEEAELEKLQYVEKSQREHAELYDYNNDSSDLSTEKAFKDYQNSFSLLYEDLALQLKQKAFTQKANALLGLSFQLSPLQFERAYQRVNAYQITCSATLAIIGKEKN